MEHFMKQLLYFLLAVTAVACKNKQETTQAIVQDITHSVYASGVVKSENQYQVFATVNGLVQRILVNEGDPIKKGDPIMRIENQAAILNTESARLSADYASEAANADKLNELKINIDLARIKVQNDSVLLERQKNLWSQQIGTRYELEQRELAYQNSLTAYKGAVFRYNDLQKQIRYNAQQARKNLQLSTTMAKDFTITSETNGKVYSILKEQGEIVNPSMPVAIIGDDANFKLELQVDEYDIAKIRVGQKVLIRMDSYKDEVFEAQINKINSIMNERSKSFLVEALFTKAPPALYPNLTAEANIIIETKQNALSIPRSYLFDDEHVLLENKEKRKVVVGLKDYQRVEILQGISKDDVLLKPE
jgi:HlyD family secretion protein